MVLLVCRSALGRARIMAPQGGRPAGDLVTGRRRQGSASVPCVEAFGAGTLRAAAEPQPSRAVHAGYGPFVPVIATRWCAIGPRSGVWRREERGAKGTVASTMGRTWSACFPVSRKPPARDRYGSWATNLRSRSLSIGAGGSASKAGRGTDTAAGTPPVSRSAFRSVELNISALPGPDTPLPVRRVPAGPGAR